MYQYLSYQWHRCKLIPSNIVTMSAIHILLYVVLFYGLLTHLMIPTSQARSVDYYQQGKNEGSFFIHILRNFAGNSVSFNLRFNYY